MDDSFSFDLSSSFNPSGPFSATTFASCFPHLLDSRSQLSQSYPSLHRIISSRLQMALAARNFCPISQCNHTGFNGYDIGRSDEVFFQLEENTALIDTQNQVNSDGDIAEMTSLCEYVTNGLEIHGLIGSGSKSQSGILLILL